jgi:AcrR family transcriptional regulator
MTAQARRTQLIETATRLFSQHGFHGTTTRQIARAARVNETIIFRLFPRKDDLYAAILETKSDVATAEQWIAELRRIAAARDDRAVISEIVRGMLERHYRDPDVLRVLLFSTLENHALSRDARRRYAVPLYTFLVDYIKSRQRDGRFRDGEPKAIARAVLAVPYYHAMVEALGPQFPLPATGHIDAYAEFILGGLVAPA